MHFGPSLRRAAHRLVSFAPCLAVAVVAARSASAAESIDPVAQAKPAADLVDARVGIGFMGWLVVDAQVAIWARPWNADQPAFALGVVAQGGGDAGIYGNWGCPHWCAASLRRIGGVARLHSLPEGVFDPWLGVELTAARVESSYPVTQGPHSYPDAAALAGFDVHLSIIRFGLHAQYTRALKHDALPVIPGQTPVDPSYPEIGLHLGASF